MDRARPGEKLRDLKRDLLALLLSGICTDDGNGLGPVPYGNVSNTGHVTFPRLFITVLHKPSSAPSTAIGRKKV